MTTTTKEAVFKRMSKEYVDIPTSTRHALYGHIIHGTPTGDFLFGVLSNNLKKACWHADDANRKGLCDIVKFLYNHAPIDCWGSEAHALAWRERVAQTPDIKDIVGLGVHWLVDY